MLRKKKLDNIKRVIVDKKAVNFKNNIRFTVGGKQVNNDIGRKNLAKLVGEKKV